MRIKRKVSISCLGGRLGICLLLAFVPQLLFAQEDSVRFIRDSIQIQPEFNESLFSPFELPSENSAPSSMFHPEHSYSLPDFSLKESLRLPYQTNPSLLFRGDYSTSGVFLTVCYSVPVGRPAYRVSDVSTMLPWDISMPLTKG